MTSTATLPLALVALAFAPSASALAGDRLAEANELLLGFDAAWAERDLDALMAPFSQSFGCELLGPSDGADIRATFERMLRILPGSKCTTTVESLGGGDPVVRAFVRRRFEPAEPAAEEFRHVLYLRPEDGALRIVGLEEYDAYGRSCERGGSFRDERSALRLAIPSGYFAVPHPPGPDQLDRIFIRSGDLAVEIKVMLFLTCGSFDLAQAMREDLDCEGTRLENFGVEHHTPFEFGELKGRRAIAHYRASGCSIAGDRAAAAAERGLVRTYLLPGEGYVLAIDLDHPSTKKADAERALAAVLGGLDLERDGDQTFAETVAARRGWGEVAGGHFVHPATGFSVAAPADATLERRELHSIVTLTIRPRSGDGRPVRVDAMPETEPGQLLIGKVRFDDDHYFNAAERRHLQPEAPEHRHFELAGRPAIVADRRARGIACAGCERVAYVQVPGFIFTVRVTGSEEGIAAAGPLFDSVLSSISFAP